VSFTCFHRRSRKRRGRASPCCSPHPPSRRGVERCTANGLPTKRTDGGSRKGVMKKTWSVFWFFFGQRSDRAGRRTFLPKFLGGGRSNARAGFVWVNRRRGAGGGPRQTGGQQTRGEAKEFVELAGSRGRHLAWGRLARKAGSRTSYDSCRFGGWRFAGRRGAEGELGASRRPHQDAPELSGPRADAGVPKKREHVRKWGRTPASETMPLATAVGTEEGGETATSPS